jgi:hypothetical protein
VVCTLYVVGKVVLGCKMVENYWSGSSKNKKGIYIIAALRHNTKVLPHLHSIQNLHSEPFFREGEGFQCPLSAHHSITS